MVRYGPGRGRGTKGSRVASLTSLCLATALLSMPDLARGQASPDADSDGSAGAAVAGAALGALSAGSVAAAGAIVPCTQTAGPKCVAWTAGLAASVGATSGLLIGASDAEDIETRFVSAAIGLGAGTLGGLIVRSVAQRFGPADVLSVAAIGAGVGAAPKGAAIGLGAGALVGFVLEWTVPGFETADWLGAALGGVAVGVVTDWVVGAIRAEDVEMELTVPLRVRF